MKSQEKVQSSALLVMDMQQGIVSRYPVTGGLIANMNAAIATARKAGLPVVFVTVKFREGFPGVSPDNKSFSVIKRNGDAYIESAADTALHPALEQQAGDIQVVKRRVSAFTGSDLEVILRSQRINDLVLCGIATSGVVLSTLREAADKDYRLTVLSDCCADRDEEVHRVLLGKVFPRQAEVMTVKEWSSVLTNGK